MLHKSRVINERESNNIVSTKTTAPIKINSPKAEYSLKQNFFDPLKSSPPNEFLLKLNKRLSIYNQDMFSHIKDDILDRE